MRRYGSVNGRYAAAVSIRSGTLDVGKRYADRGSFPDECRQPLADSLVEPLPVAGPILAGLPSSRTLPTVRSDVVANDR